MSSTDTGKIRKFWDSHEKYLRKKGIENHRLASYQLWSRWYMAAFPATPLKKRSAKSVTAFLAGPVRKSGFSGEQVSELVDALRLLLQFAKAPVARKLDWETLKESAHPPLQPPPEPASGSEGSRPQWATDLLSVLRDRNYPDHIQRNHLRWIEQLCRHFSVATPDDLSNRQVRRFLQEMLTRNNASINRRNQALSAFAFYFRQVRKRDVELEELVPASQPQSPPVILTPDEVARLLAAMNGTTGLVASLLYGTGMRLKECLELRVRDIDFDYLQITVRHPRLEKSRLVPLPSRLFGPLKNHLKKVERLHQTDLASGLGEVPLPEELADIHAGEGRKWAWQWVFPGSRFAADPNGNRVCRLHLREQRMMKALKKAAKKAGIEKNINAHTLRHSCGAHLLAHGKDLHHVQTLLGHADIASTRLLVQPRSRIELTDASPLEHIGHNITIGTEPEHFGRDIEKPRFFETLLPHGDQAPFSLAPDH